MDKERTIPETKQTKESKETNQTNLKLVIIFNPGHAVSDSDGIILFYPLYII